VKPISTRTARTTEATAIWKIQDVTWDDGVMEVSGVISSCASAVPDEANTNRADAMRTQPHLVIKCRTRTPRILCSI
jgi:hypothetical protein